MSTDELIIVPKIVKAHGKYWIPPFPTHWECWIGDYSDLEEVKDVRAGLQVTINTPDWQMVGAEMEDEFNEEWRRRLQRPTKRT